MSLKIQQNIQIRGKDSPPLLFAHGLGCSQRVWRYVASAFEQSHQTILFDLIGSGESDWRAYDPVRYLTLQGYADDLVALIRELGYEGVTYVGHSAGAMIGLLASIQAPKLFSQFILIGASPCYANDGDYTGGLSREMIQGIVQTLKQDFPAFAHSLAPMAMGHPDRPELAMELAASFCAAKTEIIQHFAEVVFHSDYRGILNQVTVPTLVVQCSQDAIVPDSVGRFLHENIRGSRFLQLQSTGHYPQLSAPEETIQAIQSAL